MQPKLSAMLSDGPISQIEPAPRQAAGKTLSVAVQHHVIIDLMDRLLCPKGRLTPDSNWPNPSETTPPNRRSAKRPQATLDLKA